MEHLSKELQQAIVNTRTAITGQLLPFILTKTDMSQEELVEMVESSVERSLVTMLESLFMPDSANPLRETRTIRVAAAATTEGDDMLTVKSWDAFRDTGLFMFANTLLKAFGWSLVAYTHNGKTMNVYPARTKFRGFSENKVQEMYAKIGDYLKANAADIQKERKN